MTRILGLIICVVAVVSVMALFSTAGIAQSSYTLVSDWPAMPAGSFFGQADAYPDQETRNAQRAAQQAQGGGGSRPERPTEGPRYGTGVSGIAIDDHDRIYIFNRGIQTVMVFDHTGNFLMAGGETDQGGDPIAGGWLHSGEVDWDGNVWVVERSNQRILKLSRDLSTVVMQLGTTGSRGNDENHFDEPSGVSFTREGNIIVTDGYGNNRVVLFTPEGKFIKQIGRGAGGPEDTGTGPSEWELPHQAAIDADDNVYIVDRENKRIQVFDNQLNYIREFANEGWNPWDIAISRKGDDGFGYIADHATEQAHKISLADGKILATWGSPGHGPGEFDWVHGMAVDTHGAVYAADTYGQRVQKFVPDDGSTSNQQ
jgi:DNA-binding beta-propeller fold protein YncE